MFDVYISGNEVSIEKGSLKIRADKQVNTCSFRVIDKTNSFGLDLWRDIEIYETGNLLFKGYITDLQKERYGVDGGFLYSVSGEGLKGLAKRKIVREDVFRECYFGDIVNGLIERYLAEEGIKKTGLFYPERYYRDFIQGTLTNLEASKEDFLALKQEAYLHNTTFKTDNTALDQTRESQTTATAEIRVKLDIPNYIGNDSGGELHTTPIFEKYDSTNGLIWAINIKTYYYNGSFQYAYPTAAAQDDAGNTYTIDIQSSDSLMNIGQVYQISITWDNGTFSLYLDGVLIQSKTATSGNLQTGSSIYIYGNYKPYLGYTDSGSVYGDVLAYDLRVWKKALTQAEIDLYKDIDLAGNETDLVYYWPVNETQTSDYTTDVVYNEIYRGQDAGNVVVSIADSGDRIIELDLSDLVAVDTNEVAWESILNGGVLDVYSSISTDNGTTWNAENLLTNGGSVPDLPAGDLTDYRIRFRFHFEVGTDGSPQLFSFTFRINSSKIEKGEYINRFQGNFRSVFEALDSFSGYFWEITNDFFLVFRKIDNNLKAIDMANYHKKNVSISKNNFDYRNIQIVKNSSSLQSKEELFNFNFPVSEIELKEEVTAVNGKPQIYVDGTKQIIGELPYDSAYPYLFQEGENKIYCSSDIPANTDIKVVYNYFQYDDIEEEDAIEISRVGALGVGSGKIEAVAPTGDVSKLLSIYKKEGVSITFMSLADIMNLGDYLDFTMSDWGIQNEIGYCAGKEITEEAGLKIFSYEIEILNKADWTKFFIGG